jgi:hypothetical protein
MKKITFGFILLAISALSFTSCEKCTTCTVDVLGTTTSEEFCGKGSEVDDFEAAWESTYSLIGDASCTRN